MGGICWWFTCFVWRHLSAEWTNCTGRYASPTPQNIQCSIIHYATFHLFGGWCTCCYYLCDNGYANSKGFLTPYKGVRYHLKEWGPGNAAPQNPKEMFNIRHSKARNIIDRAFAVLKMRWGILRIASYYPIITQIRLIMACFLLHNFIRREMTIDPIEAQLDGLTKLNTNDGDNGAPDGVNNVDPSSEWSNFGII